MLAVSRIHRSVHIFRHFSATHPLLRSAHPSLLTANTLQAPLLAKARFGAECARGGGAGAPTDIIEVSDRTSFVIAMSEVNDAIIITVASDDRVKVT